MDNEQHTREMLIELLQGASDKYINLLSFEKELIADHLITNGVTVHKWIPVTERLPDQNTRVLVYLGKRPSIYTRIDTDRMRGDFWIRWHGVVTHWMPLIDPPKGD